MSDHLGAGATLHNRLTTAAPWLLGVSVVLRLAGSAAVYRDLFPDLRVYVLGGSAVSRPGTLYDPAFAFVDGLGRHLAFLYPPFAALLFYPLHHVPFAVVAMCWMVATIAALYGAVRICQRMTGGGSPRSAMLWTSAAMWFEPIRSTLDLGQINVFLMLAVLYAAQSSRWWLSGLIIGLAAGVKLTPAITGVYLLGMRRWAAATASVVGFAATVGLAILVIPRDTKTYFTASMGEVGRVGTAGYAANQSWLGVISRILGYDIGRGALLGAAILGTAVLGIFAWRAIDSGAKGHDGLGALLVVELFSLTASPISWAHHWVWVVPLVIWLSQGPLHEAAGATVLRWVWLAAIVVGLPTLLSTVPQDFSRPWYLAWSEAVYVPLTLATFSWMTIVARVQARVASPEMSPRVTLRHNAISTAKHFAGVVGVVHRTN
ncbi:mannosyltransferase [Mycolicibacterium sp. 050158]|uniref:mannosyltransferase n=1 Tax=Mycolicibacterium sp. 050158 TaxID=3090602 RepID=UPI00299F4306|nr:mannosyltransferase [Mycolicibacterium sp. 050158]MDX1892777.1 mannosyltransferase [Mycolicibacterium sp. 050158]